MIIIKELSRRLYKNLILNYDSDLLFFKTIITSAILGTLLIVGLSYIAPEIIGVAVLIGFFWIVYTTIRDLFKKSD